MSFAPKSHPSTEAGLKELNGHLATNSYIEGFSPSKADNSVFVHLNNDVSSAFPHVRRWANHIASFGQRARESWAGFEVKVPARPASAASSGSSAPAAAAKSPVNSTGDGPMPGEADDIAAYVQYMQMNQDEWSDEEKEPAKSAVHSTRDGPMPGEADDVAAYLQYMKMNQGEWSDEEAAPAGDEAAPAGPAPGTKVPGAILTIELSPEDSDTDWAVVEKKIRAIKLDGVKWEGSSQVPFVFGMMKLQMVCQVWRHLQEDNLAITTALEKIEGISDVGVINEEGTSFKL